MIPFEELTRRVGAGEFRGLYVASDAFDPWIDEADSNALRSKIDFLVVQDTTVTPLAHLADVVLAGATFAEKAGSYVNADRPVAILRGGAYRRATARFPTSTCWRFS